MHKEKKGSKSVASQASSINKKKKDIRPYSYSYFHLASIFSTFVGIILIILYLILILEEYSAAFGSNDNHTYDIVIPVVLLSIQIGATCYNIRRQSITNRPIVIYYIFFNAFMTELSHRLLKINDMYFMILLQGINDFYTLQIIPQTWIRSLLLFSTGGYFMLRKQEIPSVFGFVCWFLVSLSFYAQEFNIQTLVKSFETDYESSNKELKQIKRALQSIPDGVAIIYDDIICYSNYSMQKNLLHTDTNDILVSFEEIFINPEESNFYFEHRVLDEQPRRQASLSVQNNPLFMSDKNSEKSSKEQLMAPSDVLFGERTMLKKDIGNSNVIDLDIKTKNVESKLKIMEDKFADQFRELGIKNLRYLIGYILSKPSILGTGLDDSGSTVVFTNCPHPKKNKVFDIKVKKVTWNKDKAAIMVIFVDRTLKSNAELLMKANKFKDAVLAYVSHEIKTPLNAMLVNLENLRDTIPDENIINNLIKPSINSGNLLQSTITDLDLIGKIEKQDYNPKIVTFALREFLLEILELFKIQIYEKNLQINLEIYPKVPERVRLCPIVLRQLLINLISNSVKYTFRGFIKISVTMDPEEEDCLNFRIIDSGVGIKDEDMDKIGKIFYKQTERRRNFQNTGIGLGLHICTNLIQYLHGENIQFSSTYGHGTSVFFKAKLQSKEATIAKASLRITKERSNPLQPPDTSEGISDALDERGDTDVNKPQVFVMNKAERKFGYSKSRLADGLDFPDKKSEQNSSIISTKEPSTICKKEKETFGLLVVDDNQLSVLAIKNMLLKTGILIGSAANGELAIEKLLNCEQSLVKLIIMDLNMPIMDGIECTKKLKAMMKDKLLPEIPIIVSSAAEETPSEETKALFVDSLPKPVERTVLLEHIKTYFPK